jgi:hypothetical protein
VYWCSVRTVSYFRLRKSHSKGVYTLLAMHAISVVVLESGLGLESGLEGMTRTWEHRTWTRYQRTRTWTWHLWTWEFRSRPVRVHHLNFLVDIYSLLRTNYGLYIYIATRRWNSTNCSVSTSFKLNFPKIFFASRIYTTSCGRKHYVICFCDKIRRDV